MSAPRRYPGHTPVRHAPGDWRCKCGVPLRSRRLVDGCTEDGELVPDTGRRGARDAMRFHRADLWMALRGGS